MVAWQTLRGFSGRSSCQLRALFFTLGTPRLPGVRGKKNGTETRKCLPTLTGDLPPKTCEQDAPPTRGLPRKRSADTVQEKCDSIDQSVKKDHHPKSKRPGSRWRETSLVRRLVSDAINCIPPLKFCIEQFSRISAQLSEPPRKRKAQPETLRMLMGGFVVPCFSG